MEEEKRLYIIGAGFAGQTIADDIRRKKVFGTVTLAFVKNRWLVTGFDLNESQSACPINEFLQDRKAALDECGGDALLAEKKLKEKYEWIPSDKEMAAARIEIETRMAQND